MPVNIIVIKIIVRLADEPYETLFAP